MVCLDVAKRITEKSIAVYFRPSMNKFKANNFSIDVVRTSSHASLGYLNRQIILLLSSLGIDDRVFLSLQKTMWDQSKALTEDPKAACESLKDLGEFGGNGYHAFLIALLTAFGKRKEPFTYRLILVLRAFIIKELRTKAKILVPNSWNLFGVVDETNTLQYGEVFVQIEDTTQPGNSKKILEGPVIVTRNPCFHPGKFCSMIA